MIAPTTPRDAWAEYDALPAEQRAEVLNGRLVCMAPATTAHNRASMKLAAWLSSRFEDGEMGGPGGWWFTEDSGYSPGNPKRPHRMQPDLMGWRKERMPSPPVGVWTAVAPDWIGEVLSDSTEELDRGERMEIFAQAGVRHVWIVDVKAQTLEVYENDAGKMRQVERHQGAGLVRARPFAAAELRLSTLWPPAAASNEPAP